MVIAWHTKLKSRLDFNLLTDGNPKLGSFLMPDTPDTIITIIIKSNYIKYPSDLETRKKN